MPRSCHVLNGRKNYCKDLFVTDEKSVIKDSVMKNLPDKIYLNLGDLTEEEFNDTDFKDLSQVTWSEDDVQGRNAEYVRKEAFIEKACEWLRAHSEADYFELIPYNYCGAGNLNKKKMIDDFKKNMEE